MGKGQSVEPFGFDQAVESADYIAEKGVKAGLEAPRVSVTLGSGLKGFADRYAHPDNSVVIPTKDIPHFPQPNIQAAGHDGKLIITPIEDGSPETMAIWAGRVHYYQRLLQCIEGNWEHITDPEVRKAAIGFYIAVNRALGIDDVITSNAVGASNPLHPVGDLVALTDHIISPDDDFGVPEEEGWFGWKADAMAEAGSPYDYGTDDFFYSQANLYSPEIRALAREVATDMDMPLHKGVLSWRKGRGYENPAFVRMMHEQGVQFFGMSTAPEAQKARSIGHTNKPNSDDPHFGSLSLITNRAQLTHELSLSHGEVSEAGAESEDRVNPFMLELVKRRVAQRITRMHKASGVEG
jgi:purine-nucleoside phosphorylase